MPGEKTPGKPTTRRYSDQEKVQAVRLVRQLRAELGTDQGTVCRVAKQLGYGPESVRAWVRQADIDEGVSAGTTTAEAERIKALEQENRELRRGERDPQAGVGFLRGGARPPAEVIVRFIDDEPRRVRSRAHLHGVAGGSEHVLRGEVAAAVGPGGA